MAGYLLLLADLVLVALLLTVVGYLCIAALRTLVGGRRRRPTATATPAPTTQVYRRCETCKLRWAASPSDDMSFMRLRLRLRLRRTVRRAARSRKREVEWARPQGWSRCPSCLSRQVRDSRRQSAR